MKYLSKMKGGSQSPPRVSLSEMAWSWIAVIGSEKIHELGFLYVFVPVGAGVMIMLLVALIINNLAKSRRYPEFWF